MNPYQSGKIYRMDCGGLTYIGSTITSLRKRLSCHKSVSNRTASKKLFELGIPVMNLVENFPCNNSRELCEREEYWIEQLPCINEKRAFITKEEISEYKKQYREEHKSELLEKQKQYCEEHKSEISEKQKQHYADNKSEISEKNKQKITCDICGSVVRKADISKHKKTKKCMNFKK